MSKPIISLVKPIISLVKPIIVPVNSTVVPVNSTVVPVNSTVGALCFSPLSLNPTCHSDPVPERSEGEGIFIFIPSHQNNILPIFHLLKKFSLKELILHRINGYL
jgi:hypothetical protein